MDSLERRVNAAINQIRLEGDRRLSLASLSRRAGLSPFHFHRTFKKIVGETVLDFSSRTRMATAARLLRHWRERTILDLALLSGYHSASDFSRAFRKHYGLQPRELARGEFATLNEARASRKSRIASVTTKKPRAVRSVEVRHLGPLDLIYRRVFRAMESPLAVKAALTAVSDFASRHGLLDFSTSPQILGVSWDDFDLSPSAGIIYDAAVVVRTVIQPPLEPGMGRLRLPAAQYAIFEFEGDLGDEEDTNDYIGYSWLAQARCLPARLPHLEVFRNERSLCDWDRMRLQLFVPIVGKDYRFI